MIAQLSTAAFQGMLRNLIDIVAANSAASDEIAAWAKGNYVKILIINRGRGIRAEEKKDGRKDVATHLYSPYHDLFPF